MQLAELAARIGAQIRGDAERAIEGVAPLDGAGPAHLAFYANPRYRAQLAATRAGAVIVSDDDAALAPRGCALLVSAQPYVSFARASALFHPEPRPAPGVRPGAHVDETARVDASAAVLPGAVVGARASIGPRTVLHPGACVLDDARVGADCTLHAGAVVRDRCVLGDRVILQPNAVIGSDGFGFAFDLEGPQHLKVPQAGIARVEDDVEIGACACVDRATLGETVVGRGTKIDNLVQVAHNVRIGPLSLLVAQCGVSGSTELGAGVILAGQVGVVGHLQIGDGVRVGAQSGVAHDLPAGETVSGTPAVAHRDWLRQSAALRRLPELLRELKRLAQRVAELEARS